VNYTRPRKVHATDSPEWISAKSTQKAIVAPNGMGHNRVDKASQEDGVAQVRNHLTSFREGSRHDGNCRCTKRVLEKPKGLIDFAHAEKVCGANKGNISPVVLSSKGKSKPNGKEGHGCSASIELQTCRARTRHGEIG
jgi:hypothetical protein